MANGETPGFDVGKAHRFFSAHCFNEAWRYIDQPRRMDEERRAMIHAAHSSFWHWTQRPDCAPRNLSIGYWQLSRVHALAGEPRAGMEYALLCIEKSRGEPPFYLGYGHEAAARAAIAAGDRETARSHLEEARRCLAQITDGEEREMLEKDLSGLGAP